MISDIFFPLQFVYLRSQKMSIKVAVVGFGFMGQTHTGTLLQLQDTEITGIIDLKSPVEQLNTIKGNNDTVVLTPEAAAKLPWFRSWEEFIAKAGAPDAVIVALPTKFHCSAVVKALENGCHVMVEKPFATSVEEAEKMLNSARKNDRLLAVGYVVRCMPEYLHLAETLRTERLGKVHFLEMRRFAGIPGWGSWLDPEMVRHSGGTLFDLLSHDLDFVTHTLGEPEAILPRRRGRKEFMGDWLSIDLQYKGFDVVVESAFIPPVSYPFHRSFQAFFENGSLYSGEWNKVAECSGKEVKNIRLPETSPYFTEVANFINSVKQGKLQGICSGDDALITTRHCAEIRHALQED